MSFAPTAEQAAIVAAATSGQNLVIQAGAGTGKTSTLRLIAEALDGKRCLYIAFNKAIANEAAASMGSNVKAQTAHSLAFQAVGKVYAHRLKARKVWPREIAKMLGARPVTIKTASDEVRMFSDRNVARMVMDMVATFCRTADAEITLNHFPLTEGIDGMTPSGRAIRGDNHLILGRHCLPYAKTVWADLQRTDGQFPFSHDHYLKMYQLSSPKITADVLFLDEAQDANPVIAAIVEAQEHLQTILVGDSSQAIYGFTGAVDAMAKFEARGVESRVLSQSFRFGPAVADVANVFLDALDAPLRITGFDKVPSIEAALDVPGGKVADAVLCRTNAGCLGELISAQEQGRKAAIVGGTKETLSFIEAAQRLQAGQGTEHAVLCGFTSWADVEKFVAEEETTGDLATMVKMIGKFGLARLQEVLGYAVDERNADVVISTAHKSKGREWDAVRIADFDLDTDKVAKADLMLAYVAVTRAKVTLDVGTLSTWIDEQVGTRTVVADEPVEGPSEEEGLALLAQEAREVEVAAETRANIEAAAAAVEAAKPVIVGRETYEEVFVAVDLTTGKPVGPRFTFPEAADAYAGERGLAVGFMTVTYSEVEVLKP